MTFILLRNNFSQSSKWYLNILFSELMFWDNSLQTRTTQPSKEDSDEIRGLTPGQITSLTH